MGCDATVNAEVLNVTVPSLSVPVPIEVPLSLNVTVPVAVYGMTVAVKVTESPMTEGFSLESSQVVVSVLFTVWVNVEDVLLA